MRSDDGKRGRRRRRAALALGALALAGALVLHHEASVRNVYDELLLEGPGCALHLALPRGGAASVPAGFEAQGSGVERSSRNYRYWRYEGDGLGPLFAGEPYEAQGLYLSLRYSWYGDEVDIYAQSGYWAAPDGDGYRVEVHWTYDAATRTLKIRTDFSRDEADRRYDIPAGEFLAATGLAREDVERWAERAYGLVVGGYLEANGGRTRFSGDDLGEFDVVDATDWGGA